ncbi:unnamed protein product, partial [Clonostachys rosea f. rosea IK726]
KAGALVSTGVDDRPATKPSLDTLISTHDFELVASKTFSPKAWAFVSSAATDLCTKQRNATTFSKIRLRPRALRDVSKVDLGTTMLGHRIRAPLFCSPVAMSRLVHEEGEKDVSRACKTLGIAHLDTSSESIMVLLEMHRNCPEVFRSVEVYVDGGITRGTDVFKALCLGAKAVGIGRGQLYGLNYGHEGVARYIEILRDELETTMKMCGVTSIDQLHPGYLNSLSIDHQIPTLDLATRLALVKSKL